MQSKYFYHGSLIDLDINIDKLEPRPSKVINPESAVFATNTLWLSIFFIAHAADCDIESGFISGKPYILEQYPGAFDKILKGKQGYIYYLSPDNFESDPRLGLQKYEFISKKPEKILKKEKINDIYQALTKTEVNMITFDDKMKSIHHYTKIKNVQIILFGDVMTGSDAWFYDLDHNKVNFVDKLRDLGNIIVLKPTYVNFMRYSKIKQIQTDVNRKFTPKTGDINFTVNDLQFETYAKWVYQQIDSEKKYIAIGLDQGAHFAKYFVNKYDTKCISLFILIDRILTKENYEKTFESQNTYDWLKSIVGNDWEKYKIKNVTNQTISDLLYKITHEENNEKYIELLNGICKGIVRSQYDKIKFMKVNTIVYSDVNTLTPEKLKFNKEFNKNGKVIYYYINDDAYYPFYGKYQDSIYDQIYGSI